MPEREVEIIESGRAWMAGEVPNDVYFSKVVQSTAVSPGQEFLNRLRSLIAVIAWWRKSPT
ncbi:hypothetical protein [Streptomyces liliifuscus]|uniref:Uncharacterized protein n=1 Tax=Streptomyces liliifuscus TaxID=2797636 RepID=A0A7T7KXP5_9ACTN|nr:hypothetical protein [Streptomyces liliifuscus]QQM42467.1 hypothetical protein JEQ17_25570 [Streptomyces liliifuscus]